MASPIDRLYSLKFEAAKQGWIDFDKSKGAKFLAGIRFWDELLMEPNLRWRSRSDINAVFGIPIEKAETLAPDAVRLVFELDG